MKRLKAFIVGFTLFAANIAGQFICINQQSSNFEKYQYSNQQVLIYNTNQLACVDYTIECK